MKVDVYFEHTSGGDSLLPKEHRGFFDDFFVTVEAETCEAAEQIGMSKMYETIRRDHSEFVNRALGDLVGRANGYDD